jgi:hypothetical protein
MRTITIYYDERETDLSKALEELKNTSDPLLQGYEGKSHSRLARKLLIERLSLLQKKHKVLRGFDFAPRKKTS